MIDGWMIYKSALIPTTSPHEEPNLSNFKRESYWRKGVFLIKYTTEFDCECETEWWYCIKDKPFELSQVNTKKRYEIKRGLCNIEVRKINSKEYADRIVEIMEKAYADYPKSYRPKTNKEGWRNSCINESIFSHIEYWGMFVRETSEICGYAKCILKGDYVNLAMVKVDPYYLKTGANAALIYELILEYINNGHFRYICDGERNIVHKTNYQDYLIKYFGFRRAYCKLHIRYRTILCLAVNIIYPFRKVIKKLGNNSVMQKVNALLELESIRRSFLER